MYLKNYRLFISHSWAYSDAYNTLVSFLNEYPYFQWSDHSVPKDDPIHNAPSKKALHEAIERQMAGVNCTIIMAGVYSSYSEWINKEIEMAKKFGKPIIAVEPWGSERTSQVVKDNASVVVGWNSGSIVQAIRDHAI